MLGYAWLAIVVLLVAAGAVILIRASARNPEADVKESDVEAALEGALIRELSDITFGGRS